MEKMIQNKEYAKQVFINEKKSISTMNDGINLPAFLKIKLPESDEEIDALFQKNYDRFIQDHKDQLAQYEMWNQNPESGIPQRYWHASFFNFETLSEAQKMVRGKVIDFVERPDNDGVLILTGPKGTGKTHLGASAVRATLGHYASMEDIIHRIDSSIHFSSRTTEEEVYEFYSSVNFLVIDEIGRSLRQEHEMEILSYLLRKRYDNQKPTILITNLTKDGLLDKVGEAVTDRLFETGECVEFSGESYRLGKRVSGGKGCVA